MLPNCEGKNMKWLKILLIPLLILALSVGVVGCGEGVTPGDRISSAREAALETDLRLVKDAVDAYFIYSGNTPTVDGKLPAIGEYAPIDFYASFSQYGNTQSLYPDFLIKLPRHHDEEIWRIDSAMKVSVDIDPGDY